MNMQFVIYDTYYLTIIGVQQDAPLSSVLDCWSHLSMLIAVRSSTISITMSSFSSVLVMGGAYFLPPVQKNTRSGMRPWLRSCIRTAMRSVALMRKQFSAIPHLNLPPLKGAWVSLKTCTQSSSLIVKMRTFVQWRVGADGLATSTAIALNSNSIISPTRPDHFQWLADLLAVPMANTEYKGPNPDLLNGLFLDCLLATPMAGTSTLNMHTTHDMTTSPLSSCMYRPYILQSSWVEILSTRKKINRYQVTVAFAASTPMEATCIAISIRADIASNGLRWDFTFFRYWVSIYFKNLYIISGEWDVRSHIVAYHWLYIMCVERIIRTIQSMTTRKKASMNT